MAVTDLAFKLFAIDEASPVFGRVAKSAEAAGVAAETAGKKHLTAGAAISKFASVGTGAAILIGGASLKMAANFQEGLTTLVTGAGESEKNLKLVGDGIKKISTMSGSSTKDLTDGMYMIESAGYHGKAGLDVLAKAAEGARVGNAQLGDVANGVTTIMTDYKGSNINATQATNGLIKAVSQGKTHMQDLAESMATIAPIASTVGVKMSEMLGAMAELTSRGVPAAVAATMMKQTLINLKSPSSLAKKSLHDLGLGAYTLSNMLGKKGLAATFEFLRAKMKAHHLTSAETVNALKNISGGSKTLAGALILSGQGLDGFREKSKAVAEATDKSKKGIEGWGEVQKDFNFKLDHFKAAVQVAAINLGQKLLPIFSRLVDKVSPFLPVLIKIVAAFLALSVIAKIVVMISKMVEAVVLVGKALRFAAVGMGIMNAELAITPVGWIIIAIAALVAIIVVIATKTKWFQTAWHVAWAGIKIAAFATWGALKVAFNGIVVAVKAVGGWFKWLYSHVIKPTFDVIAIAAKIFVGIVGAILVVPIYLLIKHVLAPVFVWLYRNIIKPQFDAIVAIIKVVGQWAKWLWTNAIKPAFQGIATIAKWLYANVIKPQFDAMVNTVKDFGKWGRWLWTNAIKPAFQGIATVTGWLYRQGVKPIFDKMVGVFKDFGKWGNWLWTNALKPAWGEIVKGSKSLGQGVTEQFNALKKGVEIPVRFVINDVMGGLAKTWNSIIGKVGLKSLSLPVPHVGFADGGYVNYAGGGAVRGPGGPRDDKIPAMLSNGEYVIPAHVAKGNLGFFDSLVGKGRRMQSAGAGFNGGGGAGGIPGYFSIPNPINTIKKTVGKVVGFVKGISGWILGTLTRDVVSKVLVAPVEGLLGRIPGGGVIGDFMKDLVPKALTGLLDLFMKKNDSAIGNFKGGQIPAGQHRAVILAAMKAAGVPPPNSAAQWLAGMNTLITRESGWNAGAVNRTDSNAKAGHPSQGLAQTIPGTFNAYVPGSLRGRGILDPVANVAAAIRYIVSRYGGITRVQQANASMPPKGYMNGGLMGRGWSIVGEAGAEMVYSHGGSRVLSAQRTSKMLAHAGGAAGQHHGTVEVVVRTESGKEIERKLVTLKSKRGGRKFSWEG